MRGSRWVTFACYCVMTHILGMHYFNIYPNIKSLGKIIDDFTNDMFQYIYPILYTILGPICYSMIWRSFYWSNCLGWLSITTSIWLKFFDIKDNISGIIGHIILIACSSLIIPGTGALAVKYFKPTEYFFVLVFSSLSHLTGIVSGKIINSYADLTTVFIVQGIVSILCSMIFVVFSEPDTLVGKDEYLGFFQSLKVLLKDQDRGILFFTISAEVGLIYCSAVDSYTLANSLFFENQEIVFIHMGLFCAMGVIGGLLIMFIVKQSVNFGVFIRLYMAIPFLMIFLLNFVFKGPFFYSCLCIITGLTVLPNIGFMQIIGLSMHKKIIQPISINLSYYFASFFMVSFRIIGATLQAHGIYATMGYNIIQLLILVCFLSVYEHGIESRFLTKTKY